MMASSSVAKRPDQQLYRPRRQPKTNAEETDNQIINTTVSPRSFGSQATTLLETSLDSQPCEAQNEEISAIQSIYDEDCLEISFSSSGSRTVTFRITSESTGLSVTLNILLPIDYPNVSPPTVDVFGPSLSKPNKNELITRLNNIYADNLGMPVLFEMFECARQFIDELTSDDNDRSGTPEEAEDDLDELDVGCSQSGSSNDPTHDEGTNNNVDQDTHEDDESLEIFQGRPISDRKSTFQGHVAGVSTVEQAHLVLRRLKSNNKIARATHNIYAYRIFELSANGRLILKQDSEDDGEHAAGGKLAHLLEMMDAENVIVIVSRWYGGIHLGPDRFKHINAVAHEMLLQHGFDKRAVLSSNDAGANNNSKKEGKSSKNKKKR